jgi:hypothetical protein
MKKIILSAVALFTIGFANAQKVEFGLKGGLNVSTQRAEIDNVGTITFNSLVGFQVGGFVEFKALDKLAIQPEVLFSTEGSKFALGAGSDAEINLSYINVPVMAKYLVSEKLSLQVGPQIGFLVAAKAKSEGVSEDFKDTYKSTNFGVNFGLGYVIAKNILVDFRYNLGLSGNTKQDFIGEGSKLKGSVFSFALGYKL